MDDPAGNSYIQVCMGENLYCPSLQASKYNTVGL